MRIGPEPTTDRFVAVMHDDTDRVVPGHALSMQKVKSDHPSPLPAVLFRDCSIYGRSVIALFMDASFLWGFGGGGMLLFGSRLIYGAGGSMPLPGEFLANSWRILGFWAHVLAVSPLFGV
jgi:hypothetical protein